MQTNEKVTYKLQYKTIQDVLLEFKFHNMKREKKRERERNKRARRNI